MKRVLTLSLAAVMLASARAWLRIAPGHSVRWATAVRVVKDDTLRTPDEIARAVMAVGARIQASCLEQGLALVMLLAAARIPSRLVIGVKAPGQLFAAHAWVECRGRIILGAGQAADFVPLPAVSPSPCRG